jgi:hypothetical protein
MTVRKRHHYGTTSAQADLLGALAPRHPTRFYIWNERMGAWRSQRAHGFTSQLHFAGKFSMAEALAIVGRAEGDEILPVPYRGEEIE